MKNLFLTALFALCMLIACNDRNNTHKENDGAYEVGTEERNTDINVGTNNAAYDTMPEEGSGIRPAGDANVSGVRPADTSTQEIR
jgi:hypothetical protein